MKQKKCDNCGNLYMPKGHWEKSQYCSRKCQGIAHRVIRPFPCPYCGKFWIVDHGECWWCQSCGKHFIKNPSPRISERNTTDGTFAKGNQCTLKITRNDERAMASDLAAGMLVQDIASKFGVSRQTVTSHLSRRTRALR